MSLQLPCRLPTTFLRQHSSIVFQSQGKAIDDQEVRSVRNVSDPFLTRRVGAEGRLFQRQSHLAIDYDSNTVRRVFKWIAVIQCKIGVFANFERANAILNA